MLLVLDDAIAANPAAVQTLVDGIARSGLWLDEGEPHREYAADFVARVWGPIQPGIMPLAPIAY